jgi:hypothetical protein
VQRESYIGPWLPEPLISDNHVDSGAVDRLRDGVDRALET